MPKITRLSQHLVNKIAAGEVVERPASVAKELLENSLDAGATRVHLEVEDGGKRFIRVSDNGCGIAAKELELAFAPHATSKIVEESDLFAIGTLGFRGEALASIASISQVEIITRRAEAIEGARLEINGGEYVAEHGGGYSSAHGGEHNGEHSGDRSSEHSSAHGGEHGGEHSGDRSGEHSSAHSGDHGGVTPTAAGVGTVVTVRNLFFNTPVRRKFLRTANTEMGHITEQFIRIAMAHNEVQMSLTHNGRKVHELAANQSLSQRIGVLFSPGLSQELLPIERRERGIEVTGLVAPPQQSRAGVQWQYVFLNGRNIRDRFVGHAIREAYRGMMEINRQPVVFIFIGIEPGQVDVNVHPAKTEVRFANSNSVHSEVLAAIRDRLLSSDLSVSLSDGAASTGADGRRQDDRHEAGVGEQVADGDRKATGQESSEQRQVRVRQAMADFFKSVPTPTARSNAPGGSGRSDTEWDGTRQGAKSAVGLNQGVGQPISVTGLNQQTGQPMPTAGAMPIRQEADHAAETAKNESSGEATRPFAQIHNRYLVTESQDGLLIIDQHALHERIIYEQLCAQMNTGPLVSQRCLIPETMDVTAKQMAALEEASEMLAELGVAVEPFGPQTVAIQGYPTLLDKAVPTEFVAELAQMLAEQSGRLSREELLHHVLDMIACKAAVKAGDPLSDDEIKSILTQRHTVDRGSNCPHGRPTTVRLSLVQLEKEFKRS